MLTVYLCFAGYGVDGSWASAVGLLLAYMEDMDEIYYLEMQFQKWFN